MNKISDVTQELEALNEVTVSNGETLDNIDINLELLNSSLDRIFDFLIDMDSSSLEERREQQRQNERMIAALEGRGAGAGGNVVGRGDEEEGGGIGMIGGLAAGAGGAVVGFGRGMASLGALAPKIILGAGAIGTAIGLIGAGIAGAAWLTGKAFPTFVEGLKSFEDVDGKSLEEAGDGLKSLGIGIAAWGVGQISAGVGNLVSGFLGDGTEDMLKQLEMFGKADIDSENVKKNSEAMAAYGKAMAAAGAGTATGGIGTFVQGVAGGLGKLFGGDDPLDSLKEFGSVRINSDNVKNNAEAMSAFAKATSIGAAGTAAGGIGTFVSGVLGGIGEAFGGEQSDPLSQLKLFGETAVNRANVENNAKAMTAFSGAMALGGAAMVPGGIGTFVNGVMGGIGEFFGGQSSDPIGELMRFGERRVDRDAVENNAEAMKAFSLAMPVGAAATAASGIGTFVNGVVGGIGRLFGGEDPIDQLQRFGERRVNLENVQNNAKAMAAFSNALSGIQSIDTTEALSILGKNMAVAIPLMEAMSNGGTFNPPGIDLPLLGDKADFGNGILDPSLRLDELAEKVKMARSVFSGEATDAGISELSTDRRPSGQLGAVAAEKQSLKSESSAAGTVGGAVNVQSNTSNNVTNNSQTVVKPVTGPTKPPRSARDVQYDF